MKRVFKFKKGNSWDGDELILDFIQDVLLDWENKSNFPNIKQDTKITLIVERLKPKKRVGK